MESTADKKSTATLIEQIFSYSTLFFNIFNTISYAFSPAMSNSLHTTLLKICTSWSDPLFLSPLLTQHSLTHCAHIHHLISIRVQQVLMNLSGWNFFHIAIQLHPFASYVLPHQMPFSQTVHLLPSVTKKQYVTILVGRFHLYCHTTDIASDIVGQHDKIGGITFGATLICFLSKHLSMACFIF